MTNESLTIKADALDEMAEHALAVLSILEDGPDVPHYKGFDGHPLLALSASDVATVEAWLTAEAVEIRKRIV